ncbi:hypothetical protein [Sediminibacter sp. Hel_I_10]|uniref:hypothetical protein n=1 Tax=Sediminibacter sp. Hel_I_10 TaxID=1392490 RepID=UPI00047EB68C|nr:hypothetical protein [Sediminibacter sp. Hel_I_10]
MTKNKGTIKFVNGSSIELADANSGLKGNSFHLFESYNPGIKIKCTNNLTKETKDFYDRIYFSSKKALTPLDRIFNLKSRHQSLHLPKLKIEHFQKSELVQDELIEDGFLYRCIAFERNGIFIILKQEVITLEK